MNDYATFQHHDKLYFVIPPEIIASIGTLHELVVDFLLVNVLVRLKKR